jgi:TolB-like protein/DNA-binding winged helix-turn-helix (wHTH) protein/Tfp pilus assembly protein PilF
MDAPRFARFGAFELDLTTLEMRRDGRRVRLAPQPARVLAALVRANGRLVSRDELRAAVWGDLTYVEFHQGLTFCIKRLRAALGDDARQPAFIETVPKRGYRFLAPVTLVAERATTPDPAAEGPPAGSAEPPAPGPPRALLRRHPSTALAIAAALILAVAALAFWGRGLSTGAAVPVRLAVLPFADLSVGPSHEFLSEGVVEELIAQLNRAEPGRIAVVARSSAMRYAAPERDLAAIAEELDVTFVVEGSLRRDGDRLRITAQLVDPRRGTPVWTNTYERSAADLLTLQQDVAAAIAQEVGATLAARPRRDRPADARVHELYLEARFFWNRRTPAELARAVSLLQEAVRLDPQYARPHAALGDAYMSGATGLAGRTAFTESLAAADRALALDPMLSEAYVTRGHARAHLFDWDGAERAFQRALELDPNYVPARYLHSELLYCRGRFDQAIREAQRARTLDPVSAIATHSLGVAQLMARDYGAAAASFRRALQLDPDHAWSHDRLGQVFEAQGRAADARAEFERFRAMDPRHVLPVWRVEARFGDRARARAGIEAALQAQQEPDVYGAVWAYAALGDRDAAFHWLDRALEIGHYQLVVLAVDPRLDPLRGDPRFAHRLKRVALDTVRLPDR